MFVKTGKFHNVDQAHESWRLLYSTIKLIPYHLSQTTKYFSDERHVSLNWKCFKYEQSPSKKTAKIGYL